VYSVIISTVVQIHLDCSCFLSFPSNERFPITLIYHAGAKEYMGLPYGIVSLASAFLISIISLHLFLSGKRDKHLPPFAPIGVREIMKKSNAEMYWAFLHISRSFGTIVRLQINPLRQIYVVSDVSVARSILNDKSSTKPTPNYRKLDIVVGGKHVPHLTTKEGALWRNARKAVS